MTNFEEREDTILLKKALEICLNLNLTIKTKNKKQEIHKLINILTILFDHQKRDYNELMEHVLSVLPNDEMGKC